MTTGFAAPVQVCLNLSRDGADGAQVELFCGQTLSPFLQGLASAIDTGAALVLTFSWEQN